MSEGKSRKFSCVILGRGTLPIRCGEILLNHNHEICTIVSSDEEIKNWAKSDRVELSTPGAIPREIAYLPLLTDAERHQPRLQIFIRYYKKFSQLNRR